MTDHEHIATLLLKCRQGTATDHEQTELRQWATLDPRNAATRRKILSGEITPSDRARFDGAMRADGWNGILCALEASRRRKRFIRRTAAAACVAVLIVAAVLFRPAGEEIPVPPSAADHISPGRERAVLILESGEQIALGSASQTDDRKLTSLGISRNDASLDYSAGAADPVRYTFYVPRGGIGDVTLADGTRVTLNSDTRLGYPGRFTGDERRVTVEGEAYFVVAKDTARPFVVEADGVTVRVTGTEFNLMAGRGADRVETTLVKGRVDVTAGELSVALTPGHRARFSRGSGELTTAEVDTRLVASWKDGMFEFDDMPLSEIVEKLCLWYDVDFLFADPAVRDIRFTGAFGKDNELSYFLDILSATEAVGYTVDGRTIVLNREKQTGRE